MSLTHIETIELGSSQSSITFSSIPQDYDDLIIKLSARVVGAVRENAALIRPNGATATGASVANFSGILLTGTGSGASSEVRNGWIGRIEGDNNTSNTFSSITAYISNYTASQNKSISADSVFENNGTTALQDLSAQLWSDTSAITSITLQGNAEDLASGSTFSLYGVTAGGDGTVTTS